MNKPFKFYFKIIAIITIFIALLYLIWFLAPLITWDDDSLFDSITARILMTVVLFLGAGFVWITHYLKQQQKAQGIENPSILNINIKKQKIILKQHVNQVFENLKLAFRVWGNKKNRYLRKLPWYIVFGSPNSGKTALLLNSGLDYSPTHSLGPDPLESGNSRRDYIWRFSKEAVILDIASDADFQVTQKNTQTFWGINVKDPFWMGIIKLIKRYRRRQPLNGAILTIALPELISQPDKFNQANKAALKGIIQNINSKLKVKIPIYFVFTKCDMLAGFAEFFSSFTKEEREQIWGISFPPEISANKQSTIEYFNKEYDRLISDLQIWILLRLELERDEKKRALISYFPQQMQLFKQFIYEYIVQSEDIELRSICFVSNIQNGESYDFLMSSFANKFHLTSNFNIKNAPQEKSFFVKKLFNEVILPDADCVSRNPSWIKLRMLGERATWIGSISAVVLGFMGFYYSYSYNKDNIALLQRNLPEYQQVISTLSSNDKSLINTLPLLTVVKNINDIYANASSKWLLYFEFYQPLKISSAIEEVWRRTLSTELMPRVAFRLESLLNANSNNIEILYQALKGYLVFSPLVGTNPNWIQQPIIDDFDAEFKNRLEARSLLNSYLELALQYPIDSIPLNEELIEKTRNKLRQVSPVEFAYFEIKQEAQNSISHLDLSNKVGTEYNNVFAYPSNGKLIPNLYTLAGYQNLRGGKSDILIEYTANIYLILGLNKNAKTNDLAAQMSPELWSRYNIDYINYWQSYLNNLTIVKFNSLSQATQVLDLLVSLRSPLKGLLNVIQHNTALVHGNNLTVAQAFLNLNNFTGLQGKSGAQYQEMIKTLTALRDYLSALNAMPNASQAEFQAAVAYMQGKAPNNPIVQLKQLAVRMPAPVNHWLDNIANNCLGLLLQGGHEVVNTAWQANLMPIYQSNIQGRFPVNAQSDTFINLESFGNFFGSNGTMEQFFQTYLQPFINVGVRPWRQYEVGGYSLGLAPNVVAQLEKAAVIRTMYFPIGDKNPSLQFFIQPRFLDNQSSSVYLQLANQNLIYRHGPQQSFSWHWPLQTDIQQVSISFSDFQGQNFSKTFDIPWAWFKLLSTSQLQSTGAPGHYVWTVEQDKHQASFDLWAANNMPIFDLQIIESFSLPSNI